MSGRRWRDVAVGDALGPERFVLPVFRLIMAAGANRDFNSIHHNSEFARSTGAPDMYANTTFLLGMWERVLRGLIGSAGSIRGISGFRMRSFNVAGDTVVVRGEVARLWQEDGIGCAEIRLWTENGPKISVGPGTAVVIFSQAASGRSEREP